MTQTEYASSAESVLIAIEKAAETKFLPIIGQEKGRLLVQEIRRTNPRHVLEVGTLIGYSAILMGKEMHNDAEIVTIEIDRDEAEVAGINVVKANVPPKITIITGNALDVIPTLQGQFDLAFIDAEKTEYYMYLKLAETKLSKGATVFADNAGIFAAQMSDYLQYVRSSGKYHSRYMEVGDDGVEISVKL
ncbi:MAG: O-methyltransferase [Betaproteobacteria bacterium]